jgi:hypothetical protein
VHSFPTTIFLRRALNNQSLVDAAFRHRKPERHTGVLDPAASSRLRVAPHDGAVTRSVPRLRYGASHDRRSFVR